MFRADSGRSRISSSCRYRRHDHQCQPRQSGWPPHWRPFWSRAGAASSARVRAHRALGRSAEPIKNIKSLTTSGPSPSHIKRSMPSGT